MKCDEVKRQGRSTKSRRNRPDADQVDALMTKDQQAEKDLEFNTRDT